ncbi:polysaccharide deacetylase family protein [Sporomusa malonica]|uniref:Peptidoglycan/xylan/chitin deacetylase, PgdA/CDA1 family n=1 Tax=Sporomusa malonica TaxID=112901 RepID=A0A1W2BHX1_9FIRM|nr:polysaccharide deacetylase family protein [Sporomusa malonica]SMC72533.1 Peptidoglycan/xylan/chitin deacetylase, PgdA/CDA1 family [Sporomusa malonica]
MFETKVRLISMLGLLTIAVIFSLVLDYFRILRRPYRLGLGMAILGITAGFILTLHAVLPENHFYGPVFSEVRTSQKLVALTFDDGPYPPYTGQILDVLKEKQIPATFFVIGQNAAKYPDMLRRAVAEGHQLGNHTYNHVDLLKADREAAIGEIEKTNKVIAEAVGYAPHVMRPPHGFRDAVVMDIMAEYQFKVVEWSVSSRDWVNPGADVIADRTLRKVKNGSVILLHDGDGIAGVAPRAQTVEATRQIIDKLLAQGYKFVTVDEILKIAEE